MKDKVWVVAPRTESDLFAHLLSLRQLDDAGLQERFFAPSLEQLTPPDAFLDMDKAVARIMRAIDASEPIVVWGDFDCDGVTSTAIMWETLHELGAKVLPYIPNRDADGHGFNQVALEEMASRGVKLIVTVDHGVTAFEEVEAARALGMEIVVTDHHEPRTGGANVDSSLLTVDRNGSNNINNVILSEDEESLSSLEYNRDSSVTPQNDKGNHAGRQPPTANRQPEMYAFPDAVAVIHPFRLLSPQPLAGCGVAYQLAYAVWLAKNGRRDDIDAREEFAQGRIELAALGTIADLVPLTGDNRILATVGLVDLAKSSRVGLQELMRLAGIAGKEALTPYDVGFVLGPRLNAPGRLADALEGLRLLCTKDATRAGRLAHQLHDLNMQRQDLLQRVTKEAREVALGRGEQGAYVLKNPDWPAGVCGLAAGRLVEELYRPVVVMEEQGEMSRGSARSIKGFDITAALTEMAELLDRFGGHAMAAGFVARTEHVPVIEQRLSEMVMKQLSAEQLVPTLSIDAAVGLDELTWELWDNLKKLEPCGMGNPQPLLVSEGLSVVDCRVVGNGAKHLKLTLQGGSENRKAESDLEFGSDISRNPQATASWQPATRNPFDAIAFGFGGWCDKLNRGTKVDVAFYVDENVWNGKRSLQLKVKDMRLANV